MKKRDNIHIKNFLNGSTKIASEAYVLDWQDPTYIGFNIEFSFIEEYQDVESITKGLLLTDNSKQTNMPNSSAVYYLRSINEEARATALEKFIEMLKIISQKAPWHFQIMTGLENIMKIDPTNSLRLNDEAILSFEMLEGFDLKITAMLDLYKKAVWDSSYHRWMLPENMRQFKATVTLTDYREIHRTKNTILVDTNKKSAEVVNDDDFETKMQNKLNKDNLRNEINNKVNNKLDTAETFAISTYDYPSVSFELDLCEFLIIEEPAPYISSITNSGDSEVAKQTLKFKVGKVKESAVYDILGIQVSDKTIREALVAGYPLIDKPESEILEKLSKKAKAVITDKVETFIKKQYLGNAYGFSAADLRGSARRLTGQLLDKMTKNGEVKAMAENMGFSEQPTKSNLGQSNAELTIPITEKKLGKDSAELTEPAVSKTITMDNWFSGEPSI